MKVIKFSGQYINSPMRLLQAKEIVEATNTPLLVVISALSNTTQLLQEASAKAEEGNKKYIQIVQQVEHLHLQMLEKGNITDKPSLKKQLSHTFAELRNILQGIFLINDLSEKTSHKIMSYGELLAGVIFHHLISQSTLIDASTLIKTKKVADKHLYDESLTNQLITDRLSPLSGITIVPGFISGSKDTGEITNLGRGGADYTAAIFAAALGASELEIWTESGGFTTANTTIVEEAYTIPELSYTEALELSNFGASVIYPPSIYPVYNKHIPITIRNIHHPEQVGTHISNSPSPSSQKGQIKGISSIEDTCLLTIQGLGMVGIIGVNYRIFQALAKNQISVFLVSQAASENSTSIAVNSHVASLAVHVLEKEFKEEIALGTINRIHAEYHLTTIAIVGENMKHTPGIAGKLFSTLGRSGISVISSAQGASEKNISFVIKQESLHKALHSIHDAFFLSPYKELNLFIVGIGTVGSNLIEQIKQQRQQLMEQHALKINVVGIARGTRALINQTGINLNAYKEALQTYGFNSSPEILKEKILDTNIFNAVFVDCTASPDIAALYQDLISKNISVVTANKIAASGNYHNYATLKQLSREKEIKFLFETNVGAGLPIINTMNSLINSGDKITKIEAVLSGSLNYIFNTMSAEIPFSKAIWLAQQEGYTEPDPRIDLSGTDVVRKLVILTREANYRVEQADVKRHLFIPQKYFDGTLEEFWKNISELDSHFEARRQTLEQQKKRLRFVATFHNGHCQAGLKEVDENHPFYDLEGSNNIIQITTERYNEFPMIIKGYGAGAGVTAAGVFADIISIANIR